MALRFHLVLATAGRTREVERFLESAAAQEDADVTVTVVDQNPDDRLEGVLKQFGGLSLRHVRSEPGLSRARNAGLDGVGADVLGFPDDDCRYPPGLLRRVANALEGWDGVTGRAIDREGNPSTLRWDRRAGPLTRTNVWRRSVSFTTFLRAAVLERVGGFDEELGLGSPGPWQSGEDTDLLLRALERGFRLRYDPALAVEHDRGPAPGEGRARAYGLGMGRVLRRHRYPAPLALALALRPLARGPAGIPAASGRLRGWLAAP